MDTNLDTHRETGRETDRKTGRDTDRETSRDKEIHKYREIQIYRLIFIVYSNVFVLALIGTSEPTYHQKLCVIILSKTVYVGFHSSPLLGKLRHSVSAYIIHNFVLVCKRLTKICLDRALPSPKPN